MTVERTRWRFGAAMDIRFEETVEEFLDHITALGLDHVELKREYLHGHPDPPSPERVAELREAYDVTVTYHAPFRDWNLGSFNDASRAAAVDQVKSTLDDAATAGAGAVVVHGGSVPRRYPAYVREKAYRAARDSLAACAAHAAEVGVPLCLENQPFSESKRRYTTSPDDLAGMLEAVGDEESLGVTLDVGHAKVSGHDWRTFADRFGDRIEVLHLSDNDGTGDQHRPLADHAPIREYVDAPYSVLEMKRVDDIDRCVESAAPDGTTD
jgi:sugar phosphate isomerase/epimerase